MTPSAARGVLEAIFWKPEFTWRVREIVVLNPFRWASIRRNEIQSPQRYSLAASGGQYFADEDRAQRHTLVLKDVGYVIRADIGLRQHAADDVAKYRDMFRRRVARGQCFQQPYLGCREFVAEFSEPSPSEAPIDLTMDLGTMLLDQQFRTDAEGPIAFRVHGPDGARVERGRVEPQFFHAQLDRGVLRVPQTPLREAA
jgi:CRISPR-associated protein Cas5d